MGMTEGKRNRLVTYSLNARRYYERIDELGLKSPQVAARLGFTRQRLFTVLGGHPVRPTVAIAFAHVLETTVDDICERITPLAESEVAS